MNNQGKTKEKLIKELRNLQEENSLLKEARNKNITFLEFEKLLTEIAAILIQIQPQQLNQEITTAQRLICEFLGLDLSAIYQPISEISPSLKLTFVYHRSEKMVIPETLIASEYFPWCEKVLLSGNIPIVHSMNDLPIEASRDRESWANFGIKSSVMFPMQAANGEFLGTISFDAMSAEQYFSSEIINRLKLIAQLFANTIKRKQTEIELIKAKEKAEVSEQIQRLQNDEIVLNNERLECLLKISQFQTNSIYELYDIALNEAIKLTESKIGYIYFYNEVNQQFKLYTWSKDVMKECTIMNPQTVYELDKTGCWGEAVRQRKPIIINDYQAENQIKKGIPKGHVKLSKFLTVPVIFDNEIVAVIGVANKIADYNNSDVRQLTLLMDNVWKISERIILIENLKNAKDKAEESEFRLMLATNSGQLGVWDWNVKDNLMIWDDRMFELYGIINKTNFNNLEIWTNGLHPDDKQKAIDECNAALNGEKNFDTSFRIIQPNGKIIHIKADGLILRDENGKPLRMIGINRDITKNKLADEALLNYKNHLEEMVLDRTLELQNANNLKDKFFSIIAHDLKNPFAGLMTSIELLLRNIHKYDIEKIKNGIERMSSTTNDGYKLLENLLEWSRSQTGNLRFEPELMDLNKTVQKIICLTENQAINKHILIQSKIASDLTIFADKNLLETIIRNLITNAIKFTNEGGNIIIDAISNSIGIQVSVTDNGVGMEANIKDNLFKVEIKSTTKGTNEESGTGLGLILCKEFIEKHCGEIWVESTIGKGSTFYFTIPNNYQDKEK